MPDSREAHRAESEDCRGFVDDQLTQVDGVRNGDLPINWRSSALGKVAQMSLGKMLDRKQATGEHLTPYLRNVNVRWGAFDLSEIAEMDIPPGEVDRVTVRSGEVVVCEGGEPGRAAVWQGSPTAIQKALHRVQVSKELLPRFLQLHLEQEFRGRSTHPLFTGTTIKHLPKDRFKTLEVPIPPLAEQDEIVRILDTQLARLDTVIAAVQAAQDKADQFRRSLLHAAFTGQLTQPDPARMNELPDGWRRDEVQELVLEIKPGFASGKNNKTNDGIPHLRPMNVSRAGRIDLTDVKYVVDDSDRRLQVGDVLFNNTNSPDLVGKTALVAVEGEFAFSNHMTRLSVRVDVMSPEYLAYRLHGNWLNGYFKSICSNHVNQASIAGKRLSVVEIEVPPLLEQNEIVRILDTQLARLDKTLEVADRVELECDRLRRSLLQAAFTGELTKNWREANG